MYKTFHPIQTKDLLLIRHGWIGPEYEWTDNVNSYGKLSYNGISRRTAIAESATGKWLFKNGPIFSRAITITDENNAIIGETRREILSRRTILTLQSGFTAEFYRPYFFSRELIWEAPGYGIVLRTKGYPLLYKDVINIEQTMAQPDLIPLLAFLGTHLTILRKRRRAAH